MEIWLQLAEEKPDIIKIQEMGAKMPFFRKAIDTSWNRLKYMRTSNLIKAQKLYSWYLIEIFNHREEGEKLLEESKKLDESFRKEKKNGISTEDFENQEEAMIFVTLDEVIRKFKKKKKKKTHFIYWYNH